MFIDKLLRVGELDPPRVFQLLDEEVDQQVGRFVQGFHKFHELNLTGLDDHEWSSFPVC